MDSITSLKLSDLENKILDLGEKKFRAKQIFNWLYSKLALDYNEMGNVPEKIRKYMSDNYSILPFTVVGSLESTDGTIKYAFKMNDSKIVEAVHIPMESGKITFCISSQVGCAMGCKFCNTASMGFIRNLTVGEIVSQVIFLKKQACIPSKHAFNIVFMGMGEPLLNLDNVMNAVNIITEPEGINLSYRRITLSTCGIVDGLEKLAKYEKRPRLAISLNGADNITREKIMPITKKIPLDKLILALSKFPLSTRERFTFEYVLIDNLNDSLEDAKNILMLLKGLKYKLNLIPFNEFPGCSLKRVTDKRMDAFQQFLINKGVTAIVRKSKGDDIKAACGQLASKSKK